MSPVLELIRPDAPSHGEGVRTSAPTAVRPRVLRAPVRPWARTLVLMLFDAVTLALCIGLAMVFMEAIGAAQENLRVAVATVVMALVMFAAFGCYATFPLPPVKEVRSLSIASSLAYLIVATVLMSVLGKVSPMVGTLALAWVLAIPMVPFARALARFFFGSKSWWSCAVVVFGAGRTGKGIVRILQGRPELGLRPVAVFTDTKGAPREINGVPVVGRLSRASTYARRLRVPYAIVAMPSADREHLLELMEEHASGFERVLVVPDLFGFASLSVTARDFSGVLAFEVRDHLLNPMHQRVKRVIDIVLSLIAIVLLAPVLALIGLLIRLDSKGDIFYAQERIGRDGHLFRCLKFRSMYVGAHERLQEVLDRDPEAAAEYAEFKKLTNDPRVTAVGHWLRKLSLDELPQLFNVLRGEMSLVGPRPYMPNELSEMTGKERMILRTLPGITGLWQVLGRNEFSFGSRCDLDVHYVRNWSMALDLYLLARTVPTVLSRKGAS
ncbi:MAG: undecaprenyl-phosphate galactose phosphotransferase WbaP [Bacteroidota bacterium]